MPISETAIQYYLSREIESRAFFKKMLPLEVEEELSHIKPAHKFTIPTFRLDQKICFLLGIAYPGNLYLTDLGLGKTGVSLELLQYFYNHGFIRRAFVFTPTNEVAEGWIDEVKKWGFTIPCLRITDKSSEQKWKKLESFKGDGIIIGTFAGISAMASKLTPVVDKYSRELTGKKKRLISKDWLDALTEDVDAVVFDQSTKLGNRTSLSFKVCNKFSEKAQVRYGLAGRAFGRDPFILWSQFYLLDRGKALGTSPYLFREAFWYARQLSFGTKWEIRKRRQKQMAKFISASSIRYSVEECIDLPKKMPSIIKRCQFPTDTYAYYDRVRKELIASKGNFREVKSAFLQLRQISSGFVGLIDDDTGERAQIEFDDNPKLDLLMELVDEVPEDRKMIIYHEFTWSGKKISEALTKAKYKHGWLYGGTKDWTPIKESFNNDPDYRILVANSKKASMGLNLQVANYTFYYESPVSAIDRYESEGRTYRNGQMFNTFYYDLVTRDTVDEDILAFHTEGKSIWKALVEKPERILNR